MLVVRVPRLSEIVTPIDRDGRLKLVSIGFVGTVGTDTDVVRVKPLFDTVIGTIGALSKEPEGTL